MLDNLRNESSFQEDEEPIDHKPPKPPKQPGSSGRPKTRRSLDQVTGMTATQRFALALMLLFIVCLFGTMLLLISGKVVPPFIQ